TACPGSVAGPGRAACPGRCPGGTAAGRAAGGDGGAGDGRGTWRGPVAAGTAVAGGSGPHPGVGCASRCRDHRGPAPDRGRAAGKSHTFLTIASTTGV